MPSDLLRDLGNAKENAKKTTHRGFIPAAKDEGSPAGRVVGRLDRRLSRDSSASVNPAVMGALGRRGAPGRRSLTLGARLRSARRGLGGEGAAQSAGRGRGSFWRAGPLMGPRPYSLFKLPWHVLTPNHGSQTRASLVESPHAWLRAVVHCSSAPRAAYCGPKRPSEMRGA